MIYEDIYQASISDPKAYWDQLGKMVTWFKPYSSALEDKESIFPKWFVDGKINMCYNCLDKQVEEGFGDEIAVIYDSPLRNIVQKITYQHLFESVRLLSGVLVDKCGVKKGDRVLFYMPMIPQCLISMLACTRIGAPYAFINAEFGYKEIAMRIDNFEPKVIFTTNGGFSSSGYTELKSKVDAAIKICELAPKFCIVYNFQEYDQAQLNESIDLDWEAEIRKAKPKNPISLDSNHPMFINYTSGTTGDPKGLVMETGGAVVMYKYYMKYLYDLKPRDVFFVMSNFSWILEGSLMSFGSLMSRNPVIIYEGHQVDRNDILELMKIINDYEVAVMICLPTTMEVMMKHGMPEDFVLRGDKLKTFGLMGELCSPILKEWFSRTFKCPLYDIRGQTELGGIGIGPFLGFDRSTQSNSNKSVLSPGFVDKILDGKTSQVQEEPKVDLF